ncbi:unnamed protein product [Allacma fusca]|uniref:Uncharacterized protein n=1 Tax=Allacma fusca TaxID=39272 RepID=A0A8J2KBK4_9HEXA|nr:unnamed protein product [Allacma fusca]
MNATFDYSTLTVPFVLTNVNSYGVDGNVLSRNIYGFQDRVELRDTRSIAVLKLHTITYFAGVILHENYYPFVRGEYKTPYSEFQPLQEILDNEYSLWYFKIVNKKVQHLKKLRICPRFYFFYTNSMSDQSTHEMTLDSLILDLLRLHDDTLTYFRIVYQTTGLTPVEFAWSSDDIGNQGYTYCKSKAATQIESFGIMKATGIFLRGDYNHTLKEEICSLRSEIHTQTLEEPLKLSIATSTSSSPEGFQFYMVGYDNDFIFFTSDGTYQVKNTFSEFLAPHGTIIRWFLLATLIVVVLVLTGLTFQSTNKNFILVFVNNLFHVFGIILEQGIDLPSLTTTKSALVKAGKIVMFFFIPSAMIFGNVYKSFLKSDFTIPVPYKTGWNNLKQLVDSDFEIFVPMKDCILNVNPLQSTPKKITSCKPDQPDWCEAYDCQDHILKQEYASYQPELLAGIR